MRTTCKKATRKIACLCALLAAVAMPACADKETFHWQGKVSREQTLTVEGFRGHVKAEQTDGEAVVDAVKRSEEDNVSVKVVQIKVEPSGSGVKIVAVYPKGKDEDDVKVRVDWAVKVPKGVKFIGKTQIGDVTVDHLDAPVEAYSAIGDLSIETSSYAQGRTVNGRINAVLGRTDWTGTLTFLAVNGDVTVKLPSDASAKLTADSKAGRFITDLFPTDDIGGRYGARPLPGAEVTGTVGKGGRNLKIHTINGDIHLLRVN